MQTLGFTSNWKLHFFYMMTWEYKAILYSLGLNFREQKIHRFNLLEARCFCLIISVSYQNLVMQKKTIGYTERRQVFVIKFFFSLGNWLWEFPAIKQKATQKKVLFLNNESFVLFKNFPTFCFLRNRNITWWPPLCRLKIYQSFEIFVLVPNFIKIQIYFSDMFRHLYVIVRHNTSEQLYVKRCL